MIYSTDAKRVLFPPASLGRRRLPAGAGTSGLATALSSRRVARGADSPLRGTSIHMAILGIAGWTPSKPGVDLASDFACYAREKFGYDASSYTEAPFSQLFQKAATSPVTRSSECNIIITLDKIIAARKSLGVEWYAPVVRTACQVYCDGFKHPWGLSRQGDCMGLYVRKDMLTAPGEAEAFQECCGRKLPQSWEKFEAAWRRRLRALPDPTHGFLPASPPTAGSTGDHRKWTSLTATLPRPQARRPTM